MWTDFQRAAAVVVAGALSGLAGGWGLSAPVWAADPGSTPLQAQARTTVRSQPAGPSGFAPMAVPRLLPDQDAFHAAAFRRSMQAQTQAQPGIVGVDLDISPGEYPLIMQVFPGTPAARAGLQAGDRLLGVDGRSLLNLSRSVVDQLISDVPGTRLTLVVQPFSASARRQVALTVAAPAPAVAEAMGLGLGLGMSVPRHPENLIYPSEW